MTTKMATDTPTKNRGYGAYNCYLCRRELNAARILFNDKLAVIRIFTGLPGRGQDLSAGLAACEQHASAALADALHPLVRMELHRHKGPSRWQVCAYAIELDEIGRPRLGKRLFVMRQQLFDETTAIIEAIGKAGGS